MDQDFLNIHLYLLETTNKVNYKVRGNVLWHQLNPNDTIVL